MANLYSIPLKNLVQKSLSVTLTQAETATITLDSSVTLELQATASMPGILVIDRVDVNGNLTPTKTEYISFTGVSGSTVTGLTRGLSGTSAQGHNIGAVVEFVSDVTWAQAINDVFTTQHNADGTHKTLSAISLASVTINNPVINNAIITGGSLASLSLTNVSIAGTITNPNISGGTLASTTILTSNIDTFSFKNLNAPEGFLINGKIVPSVASSNLTVAIKTMAGNDPSASDPVYVRIDNVIRTITGALSVTPNAGVNWLNLGSAELATKETDLFVYLQWNTTTSEVNILVSRIPYAGLMGDFTNSGLVDKGVFGLVNYNSSDIVVNIGRFAATLSAGAGYTWTVPTFNASNLIQRPIYETRYLNWVPTYSGSGSLTYTSVTTGTGLYKMKDKSIHILHLSRGTTGGTASNTLRFTIPITIDLGVASYPTNIIRVAGYLNDTSQEFAMITVSSQSALVEVQKTSAGNFGLGTNRDIGCDITLPILKG